MLDQLKQKELDFGELLTHAWKVYTNKLGKLIKLFLILQVPFATISTIYSLVFANPETGNFGSTLSFTGYLVLLVLQAVVGLLFSVAILRNFADAVEEKSNTILELINESFKKLVPFFLTSLLFILFMIPLTVAFVIPAVIFGTYWMFYGFSVVLEDKNYLSAFQFSKKLVDQRWIMTFGYSLLVTILVSGVASVLFFSTFALGILGVLVLALIPITAIQIGAVIIATPVFLLLFVVISLVAHFGLSFSTVMYYNWKYNVRDEIETTSVEEEVGSAKEQ